MAEAAPDALRIDVSDILEHAAESVTFESDVPLATIELGTESFVPTGPARIAAEITFAGTAVVAEGTVDLDVTTTCARCLREFALPVSGTIEGFYVEHGRTEDLPEDQEIEFIDDRAVDLLPAVMAAIILELPFAPIHDPSCEGLCPVCGADRAAGACTCGDTVRESPFAALKDLLPADSGADCDDA